VPKFCDHPVEKLRREQRPPKGERSGAKLQWRRARRSAPTSTRRSRTALAGSEKCVAGSRARTAASASRFAASSAIVSNAFAWCFRKLDGSTWPLRVLAGHTQPSRGFPAASQPDSRTERTRGVMGIARRADAVLPRVTSNTPLRPLTQVTLSQQSRNHSSGRVPMSANIEAIEARGSVTGCKICRLFIRGYDALATAFARKYFDF